MPVLAGYLLWQNWTRLKSRPPRGPQPGFNLLFPALLLGAGFFPLRLIQEANPDWRLVSWVQAFLVIGLSLFLLPEVVCRVSPLLNPKRQPLNDSHVSQSYANLSVFVFPLFFFLVAVPWPSFIEAPVIQTLTNANTGVTLEVLTLLGVSAVQHGNLIQVATGVVGVDEACSGIRSFQATLMISIFLGELCRFSVLKRLFCVVLGFLLAFAFNVARTTLLTWVASEQGTDAITRWHDPAGAAILVACFTSLWGISAWLSGRSNIPSGAQAAADSDQTADRLPAGSQGRSDAKQVSMGFPSGKRFSIATFGLAALILISEVGVYAWYRSLESRLPDPAPWSVQLPTTSPDYKNVPLEDATRSMLKCDGYASGIWSDGSARLQAIFVQWNPGEVAGYLSKVHNPSVCLPSTGFEMVGYSPPKLYEVHGLHLPFSHYVFRRGGEATHVFYCLWDDRRQGEPYMHQSGGVWENRLKAVWQGRGNSGQRVLELALWGVPEASEAETKFISAVERLVVPGEWSGGIHSSASHVASTANR